MMNDTSPSLIIGMHRSGTTILSKCLEMLGWYGGWLKNKHNESVHYVRLNNWILRNCGVDWETVRNIDNIISSNYDLMSHSIYQVEKRLGFIEYGKFSHSRSPWGFKDPRSSFTLPFWKQYYPNLKVVHIYRHGLDVSRSLIKRKMEHQSRRKHATIFRDIWDVYAGHKIYTTTVTTDLNSAVGLWHRYETQCRSQIKECNACSISFESLIDEPVETLMSIVDFLGIKATEAKCERIASIIDSSRALAYQSSDVIDELNTESLMKLNSLGYEY